MSTHEVENVPPPLPDVNRFTTDALLMTAGFEPGEAHQLDQLGAQAGDGAGRRVGTAREQLPTRAAHASTGSATASTRSSSIPPGTNCCGVAVGHGLHATPWTRRPARCARYWVLPVVSGRGRSRLPDLR